jgi:Mlc titration factor MtfA (ptsG expression regulator)
MGLLDFFSFRDPQRRRLRDTPLDPRLRRHIRRNVPYYTRLPPADRRELEGHVQVFLDEKSFEGCGGLAITEEIRATIAAQACIHLLHRPRPTYYPRCDAILVYPRPFVVKSQRRDGPVVTDEERVLLGQSHPHGVVVLAWDDVRRGAPRGHNVVYHEFAHQLDQEDGSAEGAPILERRALYAQWSRVFAREFADLNKAVAQGRPTDLRRYGATNPAEFFAVVTEAFFETPRQLRAKHPDLYEQLKAFYRQDPAATDAL